MVGKQLQKALDGENTEALPSQISARPQLSAALSTPSAFLLPTTKIHASMVDSAKYFLDALRIAGNDPEFTKRHGNRKRKRPATDEDVNQALQLDYLYVEGFTSDQIWEQAVRILESAGKGIKRDCTFSAQPSETLPPKLRAMPTNARSTNHGSDLFEGESSASLLEHSADESGASGVGDDVEESMDGAEHPMPEITDAGGIAVGEASPGAPRESKSGAFAKDKFGLNDGFFSIDDFNKQTELFEKSDAKGGPRNTESDDEDIDWHANPLSEPTALDSLDGVSDVETDDNEDSSSDGEGPAFEDAGFQGGPDSDKDDAVSAVDEGGSASWVNTSGSKDPNSFTGSSKSGEPIAENDVHRAISDVRRDLFEDDMSIDEEDNPDEGLAGSRAEQSAHEKQRARIADEIRRLETANVSKKEWMIAGEARAAERPVNSLIEEDLEFERIGKPVPVATAEVSEGIEDLVKRRIIAKEFDEITRRYPGVSDGQEAKRGRFELDDTKPKQSLTELYESDHLRATAPNYADPKNQKLVRAHAEIRGLWKEISSQLDTLSNWHYKPRTPQADINVVPDVATVTMEDARPTAGGSLGGSAALAPQEIYAPGDGKTTGELLLKSGAPMAKEEMTREAKAKQRRRQKKQKRAQGDYGKRKPAETAEKQRLVSDLKKGGVKVIGKEGEVTDLHGAKLGEQGHKTVDTLKL